jgi:diguanylate cyclase (GGDEF)-like protein
LERPIARNAHNCERYAAALVIAASYGIADHILNKVALGDGWQIFWPLNGITIALLIMRPRKDWALLLGAVSFGTGIGEYMDGNPLVATLLQRGFSVLEVVLSASLLPQFVSLGRWLRSPRLYPRFAAAVVIGPSVSGVLAAAYAHAALRTPFLEAFDSSAGADAMGIAAVLPLVLALHSTDVRALFRTKQWLVGLCTLAVASTVITAIFLTSQYPLIFLLYPLLMLVDWLLGLLGSSIAICGACVIAVFLTERGYGPFANSDLMGVSRNLAVQLYLGFHLIGFLPVSILFIEQRRMHRQLREALEKTSILASMDSLTNVANRRTLDNHLEEQWRFATHRATPLALLMVDADHFKDFNDKYGHRAGDQCLRAIATALKAHVSRPADLVARFGGEEFAVLLPDTPLEGAQYVAERIRAAVAELSIYQPAHEQVLGLTPVRRVTVSVGCAALVPRSGAQLHRLVEMADQALYLAKRRGRNRVCTSETEWESWTPGTATRKLLARIEGFRVQRQR